MSHIIKIFYSLEKAFKGTQEKNIKPLIPFINLFYANFIIFPRKEELIQMQNLLPEALERASKFLSREFLNIQMAFCFNNNFNSGNKRRKKIYFLKPL